MSFAEFLDSCLPRVSCLPAGAFTGQAFYRLAGQVTDAHLEKAQIEIARAAVRRFELTTDVLAFDTTNFDTHIATTTPGERHRLPLHKPGESRPGQIRTSQAA